MATDEPTKPNLDLDQTADLPRIGPVSPHATRCLPLTIVEHGGNLSIHCRDCNRSWALDRRAVIFIGWQLYAALWHVYNRHKFGDP